jgi:hypothetical protein
MYGQRLAATEGQPGVVDKHPGEVIALQGDHSKTISKSGPKRPVKKNSNKIIYFHPVQTIISIRMD